MNISPDHGRYSELIVLAAEACRWAQSSRKRCAPHPLVTVPEQLMKHLERAIDQLLEHDGLAADLTGDRHDPD